MKVRKLETLAYSLTQSPDFGLCPATISRSTYRFLFVSRAGSLYLSGSSRYLGVNVKVTRPSVHFLVIGICMRHSQSGDKEDAGE